MKMRLKYILFFLIIFVSVSAQNPSSDIREGNKLYKKQDFSNAEISYRNALEKDRHSLPAIYNLANTLYRQQKFNDATNEFQKAATLSKANNEQASTVFHNLGNSLFQQQKYADSIEAYKKALRLNPKDNDARKNLALARLRLEQQQQNSESEEDNNDDNNNDENMSKDNANKILNAFLQDEAAIQQQIQQQKQSNTKRVLDKDW